MCIRLIKISGHLLVLVATGMVFFLCPEIAYADAHGSDKVNPEANLKYLFAVFFIVWLVFFIYILFLSRRIKGMREEIEVLKTMTADK